MNEELQKQLLETLISATNTIGVGKDFVVSQAPDVIQQYLAWGLIKSSIVITICTLVVWISYKAVFTWSKQECDYSGDWGLSKICAASGGGFASLFAVIQLTISITTIAEILFAPKVWLIEQAVRLAY